MKIKKVGLGKEILKQLYRRKGEQEKEKLWLIQYALKDSSYDKAKEKIIK